MRLHIDETTWMTGRIGQGEHIEAKVNGEHAVQEAVTNDGVPNFFNIDQGCQFTSLAFTGILKAHGIQISMDGTGCWRDNVFVERRWKSIKYEEV